MCIFIYNIWIIHIYVDIFLKGWENKIDKLFHMLEQKTKRWNMGEKKEGKARGSLCLSFTNWRIKDKTEKWRVGNKNVKESAQLCQIPHEDSIDQSG